MQMERYESEYAGTERRAVNKNIESKLDSLCQRIDELVYDLYGVTAEEQQFIEK